MKCPNCGKDTTFVVGHYNKTGTDDTVYRRYRKCSICGMSFATTEKVVKTGEDKDE